MTGIVFDIQRFCLHDGAGIRTTVFLKGCPLRCAWCSNPESQEADPQLFYNAEKCIQCGACSFCKKSVCDGCGACAKDCPTGARTIKGERMSVDQVMAEVMKDQVVYETSSGGVTLSGGEPFFQGEFALALLSAAKEKELNTAVETTGYCDFSLLARAAKVTDRFLYDVKCADDDLHKAFTGVSNKRILENLKKLKGIANILPRIPLIPTFNDNADELARIAQTLFALGFQNAEMLKYHMFGESKYRFLGREYPMAHVEVDERHLNDMIVLAGKIFAEHGVRLSVSR